MNFVSSWDLNPFADTKYFETNKEAITNDFIKQDFNEKYGVIQISNTFFWIETDAIVEYSLIDNTEQCWENCEARGKATLYKDGKLFEGKEFVGIGISNSQYWIKVNEEYLAEIPATYKEKCLEENYKENETQICYEIVDTYKEVTQTREVWQEYNYEDIRADNYEWKLTGTKDGSSNVDFQIKSNGKTLTEWAWWNGTGGTLTYDGAYSVVKFTTNGTFLWEGDNSNVTVLVVAGGGGGGGSTNGAGGGAGGLLYNSTYFVSAQSYTITIGAGGTGGTYGNAGNNGANSSFGTLNSAGGGGGGKWLVAAGNGGSGGGSGWDTSGEGTGTVGQGKNGGDRATCSQDGAGGGGAGAVGSNTPSDNTGGAGGMGLYYSINGTNVTYACGGGGSGLTAGLGGCSTAGNGSAGIGYNAIANYGGGGGGAERTGGLNYGGNGGSGIVIIRYLTTTGSLDNPPTITLNSPADASTSNTYTNTFSCTGLDDIKVQNISFYINGSLNQTNISVFNNTVTTFSTSLAEGYYNWSCRVWDNATISQSAISTRTLTINTRPAIFVVSPLVNNSNYTTPIIYINATSSLAVDNWIINPNGTNYTITINSSFTFTEGTHRILLYGRNSDSGVYGLNDTFYLNIDSISPTINLISGNGTQTFGQLATNHTITYTITDTNLKSCWINYNGINTTIPCTSGILNTTNFVLTYGVYSARLWANDTFDLTTSYPFTWSYEFFYLSESYTSTLLEGTNNTFRINLVSNNALTVGNLSYDNNANLGTINNTGNNYTIIKSIFSSLVGADTNFTFFWNITKSSGVYYAFSSHEQRVLDFNIDNCSVNTINIFNLSMKDEETQNPLNASGDNVSIKIDLTLSTLSGTPITTLYKLYNQTLPAEICINDSIGTGSYLIDGIIEYSASGYAHEFYNIQKYNLNSTSNPLQNITLYDLLSLNNQPFRIFYRDKSYLPVSDALIQINRKYIDEGVFKIVEVPKTDSYGETIGNLVLNDVIYTFNIVKNGILLDSFPNVRVVCQTPTISECKLDLNAFSSTSTIFNFTEDNDFSYVLITNRTLKTTTALFTIPSGNISTIVLNVSTTDALGTSICSQSITTSGSSSLICTYPAPIGNVSLVAKLYRDGVLVGSGNINLNPLPKDQFNGFSVILALFVLLTLIGVSISDSPVTMIILFMVGVILLTAMNLVANTGFIFGATILYLIIAIVLVIIKGGKRQI
jgi:hypothetical protein